MKVRAREEAIVSAHRLATARAARAARAAEATALMLEDALGERGKHAAAEARVAATHAARAERLARDVAARDPAEASTSSELYPTSARSVQATPQVASR